MATAAMDKEGSGLDPGSKAIVLLAGLVSSLPMVALASVLPLIDHALAHDKTDSFMVKQLVGVVGFAMVFGATIVGFLIDRYPISRIILIAGLVYTAAGTAGLYLSSLPWLLASRFVLGLMSASIQVGCMTMISKRLQGVQRAHWMGLHIFAAMASGFACHPLAGALGQHGWRYPFLLYFSGLLLVPTALFMKDGLVSARIAARAVAAAPDRARGWSWFPFHYLLLALCVGSALYMPTVHVPFLLHDKGIVQPFHIALLLTFDSVAGAMMALCYGRARRYVSAHGAYLWSFGMSAIGLGIASVAGSVWLAIAGIAIYGIGAGWLVPNLMTALAAKLAPEYQGRGAGMVKAAHFLSAPLSIAAAEPMANRYGHGGALLAGAIMCLIVFVAIALRTLQQRGAPAPAPLAETMA